MAVKYNRNRWFNISYLFSIDLWLCFVRAAGWFYLYCIHHNRISMTYFLNFQYYTHNCVRSVAAVRKCGANHKYSIHLKFHHQYHKVNVYWCISHIYVYIINKSWFHFLEIKFLFHIFYEDMKEIFLIEISCQDYTEFWFYFWRPFLSSSSASQY